MTTTDQLFQLTMNDKLRADRLYRSAVNREFTKAARHCQRYGLGFNEYETLSREAFRVHFPSLPFDLFRLDFDGIAHHFDLHLLD